ncbi:MAG: hypothetical protein HPZ91_11155 [Lentisphaeria bacterium]|nr:hypothetical protein [Lentisphaeria bacterium]
MEGRHVPEFLSSLSESARERYWNLICAGLLALFLLLVFWPGLNYPFLGDWDDGTFIVHNKNLGFTIENFLLYGLQPYQDLYTPLPMYSFMVDRVLFGLDPLGYRLHNLLLHFAGCYFLFLVARRLGARVWLAFAAALLWAANPQKVESVIWITERKDVLCGALAFASLWFFLRGVSLKRVSYMAGILAALAIFAKPAAVSLPGVMVVGLICLRGKRIPWREYARILWFPVLASFAAVVWAGIVTAKTNPGVLEENWLVPLHNLFWYPLTALVPYVTNPIYPEIRTASDLLPVFFGAALAGLYVLFSRKLGFAWRKIICMLLIIAGFTVPVLGLLHYTNFHYCDRYNYLVSWAVWIAAAVLAEAFLRRRKGAARYLKGAAAAAFAAFWLLTWSYIPYWETCDFMYSYVLAKDEIPNWKVMGNSICTAFRTGNLDVIQDVATRMRKYHAEYRVPEPVADRTARFCLAHVAWLHQEQETAREMYRVLWKEVETVGWREFLWPDFVFPLFFRDMAQISILDGKPDEAVGFLEKELQVRTPDDYQYFLAEAMKAQIKQDLPAQLEAWGKVVEMEPENRLYRTMYENLKRRSEGAPK